MCKLCTKSKTQNISIVTAHAPTEEKNYEGKGKLYDSSDRTYNRCHSNDIKFIMDDLSAKIGKYENMKMFTGIQSSHKESSYNGIRLVDFAPLINMTIKFNNINKATRKSFDTDLV